MVQYRPIPDDQVGVFEAYLSYAFFPQEGPVSPGSDSDSADESDAADDPIEPLRSRRGLYPDDHDPDSDSDSGSHSDSPSPNPLCVCRHFWLDTTVRGDSHPTAGLSGVASPPEHRRQGFVRDLLAHSLEEYRDRGVRFSALWPFSYEFYNQYGWDTCNKKTTYECDPETLAFASAHVDGSFVRLEADDYERLEPVYESHSEGFSLSIDRTEGWWRDRIFSSWATDPYVYGYQRDGELCGYLTYTIDEGDDGDRTMAVDELAFVDHEAFLALLSVCHTHDSQVTTVRLPAAEQTELLDLVSDPDDLECTVDLGPMIRVVDVKAVLSSLTYPEEGSVTRTLAVEDPLADWNDGTFSLEVADGSGSCTRAPSSTDPDVTLDIGTLSQLVVGYRSPRDLARAGQLPANQHALADLEGLFPTTAVYLRDFF